MGDLKFPLLKYYKNPGLPKLLGKGAFGEVYHFISKSDQQLPSICPNNVAVKVFESEKDANFYKELSLFRLIGLSPHPNLVKFLGVCQVTTEGTNTIQHALVMEHYNCDLKKYKEDFPLQVILKDSKKVVIHS